MSNLSFTDIYDVKKFFIEGLAPKYFNIDDINKFNVGMLGYATEMVSVATEETFNAVNTMFKEHFISRATFPDTIYTKAGLYGIDSFEAIPASCKFGLYINESDILTHGQAEGLSKTFVVDKEVVIYIEDVPHTIDYDIKITAIQGSKDMIYTAQYDMSTDNSISNIKSPQLRVHKTNVANVDYVLLVVDVRQYERVIMEENLISNATLNFPIVNVDYTGQYAGMDVFYRNRESDPWALLDKKFVGLPPSRDEFVYFTHSDENQVQLSFTSRDNYFKPEYNSELKVVLYTTTGSAGNFEKYDGGNIGIAGKSEVYDYNKSILLFGYPASGAVGGVNKKTLEELRTKVIEKKGSSGAYNTDTDLETYFNNRVTENDNTFVKFIKRRDDLAERLFSCFGLYKDKMGDYFHTNTLSMTLFESQFDTVFDNGNRLIMQPGKMFIYDDGDGVKIVEGASISGDSTHSEYFTYTNPFAISLQKSPNTVSFYKNTVNASPGLEYGFSSTQSIYQFAANKLTIKRNAIAGEMDYVIDVVIKPLFDMSIEDGELSLMGGDIKLVLSVYEGNTDTKAIVMERHSFDMVTQTITYRGCIKSTDEIGSSERVVVDNMYDVESGLRGEQSIPMIDTIFNISVLAIEPDIEDSHPFTKIAELSNYKRVSTFTNKSEPVTLIQPLKHVRSTVKFQKYLGNEEPGITDGYSVNMSLVPLMSFSQAKKAEKVIGLMSEFEKHYAILNDIVRLKTQNYSLDMKFYNTFGRSKNIRVDTGLIDRTNLSISMKVSLVMGSIAEDEVYKIRNYVKDHIESLSKSISQDLDKRGYNSVYISRLTQDLGNKFPSINYVKHITINDYDTSIEVIENDIYDIANMTSSDQRLYVPEFMSIDYDEVRVSIL